MKNGNVETVIVTQKEVYDAFENAKEGEPFSVNSNNGFSLFSTSNFHRDNGMVPLFLEAIGYMDTFKSIVIKENCSQKQKEKLDKQIADLQKKAKDYAPLVSVLDAPDRVAILFRKEGNITKNILVTISSDEQTGVMLVDGRFPENYFSELLQRLSGAIMPTIGMPNIPGMN